jgi:hypothetical protein
MPVALDLVELIVADCCATPDPDEVVELILVPIKAAKLK